MGSKLSSSNSSRAQQPGNSTNHARSKSVPPRPVLEQAHPVDLKWQAVHARQHVHKSAGFSEKGDAANDWRGPPKEEFDGTSPKVIAATLTDRRKEAANPSAPRSPEEFLKSLKKQYGNFVRAWRLVLNPSGSGTFTRNDLGKVMRGHLSYDGSFKSLWVYLERLGQGTGQVSLSDLDEEAANLLMDFKEFLQDRFQTARRSFSRLDVRGRALLHREAWVEGCKAIGWNEQLAWLEPAAWNQQVVKLHECLSLGLRQYKKVTVSDLEWLNLPLYDEPLHPQRCLTLRHAALAERLKPRKIAQNLPELLRNLKNKYGSLVRAWRLGIDMNGDGTATYKEFAMVIHRFGFCGSLKDLWAEIGPTSMDGQTIGLVDIDKPSAVMLSDFKVCLLGQFRSAHVAWEAMDTEGNMFLDPRGFQLACDKIGWQGDALKLHALLDAEVGMRHKDGSRKVTYDDIAWIGEFESGAYILDSNE